MTKAQLRDHFGSVAMHYLCCDEIRHDIDVPLDEMCDPVCPSCGPIKRDLIHPERLCPAFDR